MSRHSSFLYGLGALSALAATGAAEPPPTAARPNVLVLLSDDQRADTIGALGNPRVRTPNLDRLVGRGTAFTRAYCMGSLQGAVCVPSRAMLLTGRSLFRADPALTGQDTWPEAFARAGYATFLTGKWHNGDRSALRSFQQGRAVFLGGMGDPYRLPLKDIAPDHRFVNPRPSGEHSVKVIADAAVEFLRGRADDTPFLCYVAFNAPHDPRVAPRRFHDHYDADRLPLPANFLPRHPFDNGELEIRDEQLAPWPRTPEVVRRQLADYYACIEHLDAQVGRILEALEASGRMGNTLVVFASDHGLAVGSHGLLGKQNLYDHSMRSPLLVSGPGIPAGRRSEALCYLFDIFPTLGELARVAGPAGTEGRSLVPVFEGPEREVRGSIFTAYRDVQRAVRDDRWKLIVYPKINKRQLFDLRDDPEETRDLAGRSDRAGDEARLVKLLQGSQALSGDALPLSTPPPRSVDLESSTTPGHSPRGGR
jgi:arylsulfatase A-like enzyme